jgi:hypothetical protein
MAALIIPTRLRPAVRLGSKLVLSEAVILMKQIPAL